VVSDCLGALGWVVHLPPYRILSRCRHSDILKNILVNCRNLTFSVHYSHVKVHQDDKTSFERLSRSLQLNCMCNNLAKLCLGDGKTALRGSRLLFPLEPIGISVGGEKLSSETGQLLRFHAHRQLARMFFHQKGILAQDTFNEVDWEAVHWALHAVPWLFQVWASKHVLEIAGTMKFLAHQDGHNPLCPSCQMCEETCAHVTRCPEAGRAEAFSQAVDKLSRWMDENETHPDLASVITEYARKQGDTSCIECAGNLPPIMREFAIVARIECPKG
jgi:hypothetical protein